MMNKTDIKDKDSSPTVFFGTQGVGPGKGISSASFDETTGEIGELVLAAETEAPAFFVFHPDGHTAYVCNSNNFSCKWFSDEISSFRVDASSGMMIPLNRCFCGGRDPNYLCIDRTNRYILVANYKGGNVSVLEILPGGSLGKMTAFVQHSGSGALPERQNQPYAHCVKISPDNRFALVADLGLDRIYVYQFDASDGSLRTNDPPYFQTRPGIGPRHLIFHPDGKHLYATNEINSSVSAFSWDGSAGVLEEIQNVTLLPPDFRGESACSDLTLSPDGKYLFAANRGYNSVTSFSVEESGKIDVIETVSASGVKPRNLMFSPSGRWLLISNQSSDSVTVYGFNAETGRLSPDARTFAVPNPMGIMFLPK
jgi:6-phosphogluconolactonase